MFIVLNIPIISELEFDRGVLATKVQYELSFVSCCKTYKMAGLWYTRLHTIKIPLPLKIGGVQSW